MALLSHANESSCEFHMNHLKQTQTAVSLIYLIWRLGFSHAVLEVNVAANLSQLNTTLKALKGRKIDFSHFKKKRERKKITITISLQEPS